MNIEGPRSHRIYRNHARPTIWYNDKLDARFVVDALKCRKYFSHFRKTMRPHMKWGWFVDDICWHFQQFYDDFIAGKRPKMAIMAPPQHGKSLAAEDFVAWLAGKAPHLKTIYASHGIDLGVRCNLGLQRTMVSNNYQSVFETTIGIKGWQRSTDIVEYGTQGGSFRNVTVHGAVNGLELHLGIVDDPVKDRADANSTVMREKTWNWYTDVFRPRFAANSAMLWIMTRWHIDDPLGRALAKEPDIKVLKYKAIAEQDEVHRRIGMPLFPEFKPLRVLLEQKNIMSNASWEAEYQQEPYLVGGGMFPIDKLRIIQVFDRNQISRSVLSVDKAGTEGGDGARTAIVFMHLMKNNSILIENVVTGRWEARERENTIRQCAELCRGSLARLGVDFQVVIEQEPGSGGKESAEATIRNLMGFYATAVKPGARQSKTTRADPFAAQVQNGNVWLVAGRWVQAFLDEMEGWPFSKTLDQGDAAAQGFNLLCGGPYGGYDHDYKGFQD
jgi:predicted phage terminase large subunit-like protein